MSMPFLLVPLGEVLTERKEVPSPEQLESGEVRIVSKIGFDDGKIQLRVDGQTKTGMILIRPGDLVVSGINAAKGAIAIYSEENKHSIAATIHYGSYIPNKNRVDTKYLWWLLRSNFFRDLLFQHVPGGIKTELKAKRFLPVPIPLPPLTEQQRIVARIEGLAAKIEEARGLRKQAVEEAEASFPTYIDSIMETLMQTTPKYQLQELVDPVRGISYGVVLTGRPCEDGVPTLRAGDLHMFRVKTTTVKKINPEIEKKYSRTRLRGEELLLRIRGGLGQVAVCDRELVGWNVSREIAVIPLVDSVVPKYAMFVLGSLVNQKKMTKHIRGTSYLGINLKDVRVVQIPVPSLNEQRRIVAYLDDLQSKVDALKQLQVETQKELDAMLPSVLDKAFKGEL